VNPLSLLYAIAVSLVLSSLAPGQGRSVEPEAEAIPGGELAARMSAKQQSGSSLIRLKMDGTPGPMQVQIKSRATKGSSEIVYQVLWPKERKGEAVLLRRGGRGSGVIEFTPPDKTRNVEGLSGALLGSDLSYEDVLENYFAWDQQAIVGSEVVDRVNCQILESKPGKGRSSYSKVKSWIDPRRLVPMRIEKYGADGKVVRRIETTRVAADDKGRAVPANLTVRGPRGVTELDGSRIKHDVSFSDREFSPEGFALISNSPSPE
jgi:hypothetical protein